MEKTQELTEEDCPMCQNQIELKLSPCEHSFCVNCILEVQGWIFFKNFGRKQAFFWAENIFKNDKFDK